MTFALEEHHASAISSGHKKAKKRTAKRTKRGHFAGGYLQHVERGARVLKAVDGVISLADVLMVKQESKVVGLRGISDASFRAISDDMAKAYSRRRDDDELDFVEV